MTTKKESTKRQTIEEVRHEKNPLVITEVKRWPNLFRFVKKNGGKVPPSLSGQYTSLKVAEAALARYLG